MAGVVDPDEFIETAAPPSGQLQSHMKGLFRLRLWVPGEPVTLNLHLLLLVRHSIYASFKQVSYET